MCQFIETIKYLDGQFYYLEYHQERVKRTFARFYSNKQPFNLLSVLKRTEKPDKGFYRCRIVYDSKIQTIEFIEQQPRQIETLKIVTCDTIDYSFKYLNRDLIQELVKQKQGADDILIIKDGLVTDTSIANILFFDGKEWVTPDSPLLSGTTRARLLKDGSVKIKKIKETDISRFTSFQVVNALIPFSRENRCPIDNIRY